MAPPPPPPPVTVIIAVDTSGSMSEDHEDHRSFPAREAAKAAKAFVDAVDLSHFSIGVMAFADKCGLICPPSKDARQIKSAISQFENYANNRIVGVTNKTDPFDAIRTLLNDDLETLLRGNGFSNQIKYAVVLTDGRWAHQGAAKSAAFQCHKAGIEVVALGFGDADGEFLKALASKPEYSRFTNLNELIATFKDFARQIIHDSISRG